ncbi:MAG TPA: L,D-transpeptidase family protein, partial [Egicoccus sp.]
WNGGFPRPTRRERAARARRRRRLAWGGAVLALALVAGLATSAAGMLAWTVSRVSSTVPTPSGPPPAAAPVDEPDRDVPDPPPPAVTPTRPAEEVPADDVPPVETPPAEEPVAEEPVAEEPAEDDEPALSVHAVQEHLRAYGFLVGAADGRAGQQTTAAIMAYQRVNGLAVDGVVGPATTAALLAGTADPVLAGGPDDRIEVDLDRQLLHLVEDGTRTVTLQVSSGSGETYTNASGQVRARTPVGEFVVERRVHGVRKAALGTLYDPLYFYRGFAIHGSGSVPAYPASHGCVRVPMADAAWLIQRVPDGLPVHVYGGTHVFAPGA